MYDLNVTNNKGVVSYKVDQEVLAEMTFSLSGDHLLIIDHTEVDPTLKGRGIGKEMWKLVLDFAPKNDRKIIPLCPFAKAMFDKHPDQRGLLHR